MKLTIRPARPEDAVPACHVLRRSIEQCCIEDHRNDAAILSAWLANKTPETVRTWFSSSVNFSAVALAGEEIVGVATLTRQGKIVLCYVTPEVRYTGAGKALLQALETRAREWGLRTLQVCSTVSANAFYQRNGYVAAGTRRTVYGIEAVALSKNLCPASYTPRRNPCGCGS